MKTCHLVTKAGVHLFIGFIFVLSLSRFPFLDQVKQLILFLKLNFSSLQITGYKVYDEYLMALSDTYGSKIISFLSFYFYGRDLSLNAHLLGEIRFYTCKDFVAWDNSFGLFYQYYLFQECEEKINTPRGS